MLLLPIQRAAGITPHKLQTKSVQAHNSGEQKHFNLFHR